MSEEQHENVKTVIRLYKEGIIDGSKEVCVNEGEVISMEETLRFNRTSPSFIEGPPAYELADSFVLSTKAGPEGACFSSSFLSNII
jgi:hypothetical protein